jgi:hypothetical protein
MDLGKEGCEDVNKVCCPRIQCDEDPLGSPTRDVLTNNIGNADILMKTAMKISVNEFKWVWREG